MDDMMTICKTTYTRVVRTPSLYVLLIAVFVLVGAAHLYNDLTCGRSKELMFDAGSALMMITALLTALIVVFDISRDLREKLAVTLLSKPLGRSHYLLGKFLGVVRIGSTNLFLLTLGIMAILYFEDGSIQWNFLKMAVSTWGMMVLTTAEGVLFASFFTELPAVILTLAVYCLGNWTEPLYQGATLLGGFLFRVLPEHCLLNFTTELGNGCLITWKMIIASVIYAVAYSCALLSLANIIFHKRDLA